jgi:hypothetical protein
MWAYIPEGVNLDNAKYLKHGIKYKITPLDIGCGMFSFSAAEYLPKVQARYKDCLHLSGADWRIVLKPRIRRMGVVG